MSTYQSLSQEDALAIAERQLLAPSGLTRRSLETALDGLLGNGASYADLYFQAGQNESWSLDDGRVAAGSFAITQGVGARAISGEQTAFAHSAAMMSDAIDAATGTVRSMLLHGDDAARHGGVGVPSDPRRPLLYTPDNPLEGMGTADKIRLLQEVDRRCREADPRVVQVSAQLQVSHTSIVVAGSDGSVGGDVRPLVQLIVTVTAQVGARRATGNGVEGGRLDLVDLLPDRLDRAVRTAVRIAIVNLDARPAPSGVMSVVLGNGFPGILLHEAVGHGLEADAHRKRTSVFADLMGSSVAAEGVTVIDDGTLPQRRGSLNVDDEGVPSACNLLIDRGRLVGLMQDRTSAHLMGRAPSGNGRRQSYAHLPMPRMTNTYLAAGEADPEDIVRSIRHGIYAPQFGGGTVDITSGQFNFSATEAYLIEDGRVTAPIQGATLIGLGHEALRHVSMVGNDLELADGVCGKDGQNVPVCVGQPTVRIDGMVVGGTA
ncbi:metalloprotease TldD [Sphingomonas sp. RIT328]|uniref:metalloprotease TldD n=1 Tax=Sphingomonas sp. RIT328 TaxID=1470591 RepID=UPI00044BC2DE|nr:metalloprotease TldD [Sphingomonas sp. RIT328]EZP50019.1 Peptidase U62, modulator of DNA gyrase [Sphingomonas sp. RIT328]